MCFCRLWFYIKNSLWKKIFFSVDYVKVIELHVAHDDGTCNMSRRNKVGNDIYEKDQ